MNKPIIRSVRELPEWFNIRKYDDAHKLKADSWYDLLLQRWSHDYYIELCGIEEYKKSSFFNALEQLRDEPLSLLKDEALIIGFGGGKLASLKYDKDDFAASYYGINPLTFRRMYQYEAHLEPEIKKRLRYVIDKIWGGDFFLRKMTKKEEKEILWAKPQIDKPFKDTLRAFGKDRTYEWIANFETVEIDLTIPDNILIEQFTSYLNHIRKKNPENAAIPTRKMPEFRKWADYGLLPYLDLKLWEKEQEIVLPNRVIADAIFDDGEKGEEVVRKTTKRIAQQVMDQKYIQFVSTVAAHDIMENN